MFADIASEMLYPIVPVYLQSIGFSILLIGILEGIAEATAGLSIGYFGQLSDEKGVRLPFVRWGYFLSALAKPLMVMVNYPVWVFLCRITERLGKGLRTAPRDAILSDEAQVTTKAAVFSFHRAWDTLGAVIGPTIALVVLTYYAVPIRSLFIVAFFPGLVAVATTYFIKEKAKADHTSRSPVRFLDFFSYWNDASPEYRKVLLLLIVFSLFNSSDMLLLLRVKEVAGTETQVIGVYIFYNIIYAALSYPMGILADKVGIRNIFLIGLFFFSITYLGISAQAPIASYYVLFVLYGIYMAATDGISKAWLSNLAEKQHVGTAIGLFVSLQSIALMIASMVAGVIWLKVGASATFILTGSIGLVVLLLMILYTTNSKPVVIHQK